MKAIEYISDMYNDCLTDIEYRLAKSITSLNNIKLAKIDSIVREIISTRLIIQGADDVLSQVQRQLELIISELDLTDKLGE